MLAHQISMRLVIRGMSLSQREISRKRMTGFMRARRIATKPMILVRKVVLILILPFLTRAIPEDERTTANKLAREQKARLLPKLEWGETLS